jgi:hypothetical protein
MQYNVEEKGGMMKKGKEKRNKSFFLIQSFKRTISASVN